MHAWKIALAAAVLAAASTFTIFIFLCYLLKGIRRRSIHNRSRSSLNKEVLMDSALKHNNRMARVWRTACPVKPFNWSEHPALIAEAVEHGWATFAFTYSCSTCHVSSNLWDMCTGCSHGEDNEPHISWEMGSGSDYMQKIRLNPGLSMKKDDAVTAVQALQTALPLPGPPLGPLSFPQEGYYEITILAAHHEYNVDLSQNSLNDNEHEKLIHKRIQCQDRVSLDEIIDYSNEAFGKVAVTDSTDMDENGKVKKLSGENEIELEQNVSQLEHLQILAVGLAAGATPSRLPGCYAGSVGFHSNGHLYFHGARHIQDPEVCIAKRRLRLTNGTVGCGFDPASKAVFFTFNGERVHELTTTINEFGSPLYPSIASNYDVTVLANFGQSPFAYDAANSQRVPDPFFRRPLLMAGKTGIVYEDSGDLFSMSKIDAQWLTESGSSNSHDLQHHHVLSEAESDLFEIVLEEQS